MLRSQFARTTDRYAALRKRIPADLMPALGAEDWYSRRLKKGPPKVTKRTVDVSGHADIQAIYLLELFDTNF